MNPGMTHYPFDGSNATGAIRGGLLSLRDWASRELTPTRFPTFDQLQAYAAQKGQLSSDDVASYAADMASPFAKIGGLFGTIVPGANKAARILRETKGKGGYSVNVGTSDVPEDGLMVGVMPKRGAITDDLTKKKIDEFIAKNADVLAKEDNYLGTWVGPNNEVYLDISKRYPQGDVRQAVKRGEKAKQLAIYDIGNSKDLAVGNWNDFINSQEYLDRLEFLNKYGSDYLSRHPNSDWWNIKGTGYEQTYGPGGLFDIAGFNSATSPRKLLRDNTADATEYMRRKIAGEPLVQPGFVAPPGSLTLGEGKRMRNEASQAQNLLRVGSGRYSDLSADKVNSMYRAQIGDPDAMVFDTYWARISEDPSRNIFTDSLFGVVPPGPQYRALEDVVGDAARQRRLTPNTFSANVWTGGREHIRDTGGLFGQTYNGKSLGESKSIADVFNDLVKLKAANMGISENDVRSLLRSGKISLL